MLGKKIDPVAARSMIDVFAIFSMFPDHASSSTGPADCHGGHG